MKKINKSFLLLAPFVLTACGGNSYDMPKSPFSDSYNPIGMKSAYSSSITSLQGDEYNNLKSDINDYDDNDSSNTIRPYSYTKVEETRDLKAAYFGKNIGAANLCSLKSETTNNIRYANNVTTKFVNSHVENQLISGSIDKKDAITNDFIFETCEDGATPVLDQAYKSRRYTKTNSEEAKIEETGSGTFDRKSESITATDSAFGLNPYTKDINNNFSSIDVRGTKVTFSVLADNNNAVYGKINVDNKERVIIKEAKSVFVPYSTTLGDTYKAVDNFFYEALLENNNGNYKFTNFRFYHEVLILSEAFVDEEKVPVVFLEKPQLVEYSEIQYTINYSKVSDTYNKKNIPNWPNS